MPASHPTEKPVHVRDGRDAYAGDDGGGAVDLEVDGANADATGAANEGVKR